MTAGSRQIPSSMVKNTTGLVVGTRDITGAVGPPGIGTGVGGSAVVVVGAVDRVVRDRVVRRAWVACAAPPSDVRGLTSAHAPTATRATKTVAVATRRTLRLRAARRRIRRATPCF